jgi:hypothetical protein
MKATEERSGSARDDHPPGGGPGDSVVPERPLGLSLLIWLLWFWAGAIVLVFLGFAIGDGPVMMSGQAVPRPEALRRLLPILAPMGLAVIGAALAMGLKRPWARPAVLLPFLLAPLGPLLTRVGATSADEIAVTGIAVLPVIVALVWYLYFSRSVVAYFQALKRGRRLIGPSG